VATISDIARAAGVSVESVLRVLNHDRVSEDAAGRITAAMDAYGFHRPQASPGGLANEKGRPEQVPVSGSASVLGLPPPSTDAPLRRAVVGDVVEWTRKPPEEAEDAIGRAREQLMHAVVQVAAELETGRPAAPGGIRYQALEVGPLAERMTQIDGLFERLVENIDGIKRELGRARSERLEDLTLIVDLLTTSWRTVDQRLGRIERKLERMEQSPAQQADGRLLSVSERRRAHPSS